MSTKSLAMDLALGFHNSGGSKEQRAAASAIVAQCYAELGFNHPGCERGEYGFIAMTPEQRRDWRRRIIVWFNKIGG